MDTQWPRWEVFKQDRPDKPHQAVGSVHAADPEHALLTARNIFVRRPSAVSLWVVPANSIFAITQQELLNHLPTSQPSAKGQRYLVFRKSSHKRSMTFADHVGEVVAENPEAAVALANQRFQDAPALAWWVVPAEAVAQSQPDDQTLESWFAPAVEKTYKQQSYYATIGSHVSKHKRAKEDDDE